MPYSGGYRDLPNKVPLTWQSVVLDLMTVQGLSSMGPPPWQYAEKEVGVHSEEHLLYMFYSCSAILEVYFYWQDYLNHKVKGAFAIMLIHDLEGKIHPQLTSHRDA